MRLLLLATIFLFPAVLLGQSVDHVRSSPAYSEVLLRKTELLADLESVINEYTEANPKILDLRAEMASLDQASERLLKVRPAESGKLTLALGKLIVKKAVLDMDLAKLTRSYNKDHPEVKRAKRRVEVFDISISEILK